MNEEKRKGIIAILIILILVGTGSFFLGVAVESKMNPTFIAAKIYVGDDEVLEPTWELEKIAKEITSTTQLGDIKNKTACCRHYSDYYINYFSDKWYFGNESKDTRINAYESPIIDLTPTEEGSYHIFAIITMGDNESKSYCVLDQHDYHCFKF